MSDLTARESAIRANHARNKSLSPKRRRSIARKAAKARWKDHIKKVV